MLSVPAGTCSNNFPRTPVITFKAVPGDLAMAGSLSYLFSRKERARRRNAQQEEYSPVQPPPAYKIEEMGYNRSIPPSPRPLSTFAPEYGRQAQYNHQYQQQSSQPSFEQPPPYPTIPKYDPSQYQPIRPTSMILDMNSYANCSQSLYPHPGPSSRLSAVHYGDARLSTYPPVTEQAPMALHYPVALRPLGNQDARERRERSFSEPMLSGQPADSKETKQPKPVLSRLITNFR
ncbi:hypothetical protein N7541_003431 [Penicillium brevicompactum]|uniref:Uncharacterized protein n=1 Tax=Penicillium brevicompactum TaxID=5074 RepID=A0A9W9RLT9_PENBR|nr:hypothetical protein N7541_003431 [Penicillium brevicompactum]